MRRPAVLVLLAGVLGFLAPGAASAQDTLSFLAVGDAAPDIQVTGATRYGILADPVHLSDFKGETVVVAFFFRARSPG